MTTSKSPAFVTGVIICLIGAVCFSTKAIFVKLAYRDTVIDSVSLLALRMIWVVISSVCWISSGLQYVSAGIERLILFIYPTLVLLMSALLFKQKIKLKQWVAVLVTYAGLLLAFVSEANLNFSNDKNFYVGSILIFLCAITYALYIVGSGRIIPHVGAAKFNSYAMSFACLGVLLHFFFTSDQSLFNLDSTAYLYSFSMAVFSTVIPSYLVAEGIKRIGSDNAAIVGSIGPVSTIIQANLFLEESVTGWQLVGTGLILSGVLLISRKSKPEVL